MKHRRGIDSGRVWTHPFGSTEISGGSGRVWTHPFGSTEISRGSRRVWTHPFGSTEISEGKETDKAVAGTGTGRHRL